jgi:hypothetical protein
MRGALETLQAPIEATTLEPFVRPDLCIARLRQREPELVEPALAPA